MIVASVIVNNNRVVIICKAEDVTTGKKSACNELADKEIVVCSAPESVALETAIHKSVCNY